MTASSNLASFDQDPIQPPRTSRTRSAAGVSRRAFLGQAGGIASVAVTAGTLGGLPSPALVGATGAGYPQAGVARANQALTIRIGTARTQRTHTLPSHADNGDEAAYPARLGNYTKGLPHTAQGDVAPAAYTALLAALARGTIAAFEAIPLGGIGKLSDPLAAYAFVLEGPDSFCLAAPPAPAFSSAAAATEMAELYWQALAHDIPFAAYPTNTLIAAAGADLIRLSGFQGPTVHGAVTPTTIFRLGLPGELVGPTLSQFLWRPIPYGAMSVSQRYPIAPAREYLTTFADWLTVQQGQYHPPAQSPAAGPPAARYLSTGRDLTTYLHTDFSYQTYLDAGLILFQLAVPLNPGNPYRHTRAQTGFATFGPPHLYDLVAKAANAALKACWYQKWLVHRRLRPEEFSGRVHKQRMGVASAPIHPDLLSISGVLDEVARRTGNYLLPMPYPEGAPMHPSYPAAHSTIAGACVTMLKAFFDEAAVVPDPVMAGADGSSLDPYTGPALTVGGELNKLAANVAMGRAFGGVHWRSDNLAGLRLGEAVAIGLLADEAATYPEMFKGFSLTRFDGTTVVV
jgi:hypothetical protein